MGQGKFSKKAEGRTAQPKKKTSFNTILLRILMVLLSLILVLLIVAALALNYFFGRISRYDEQETQPTETIEEFFETDETVEGQETVDPDSVEWEKVEVVEKEIINILLIGQDARPGETRARSDSMILVSLDEETGKIQLTSFMRDLYVQIPGYQDNRINSAFALGGPDLLDNTIKENFGVEVDGNVEVNFEAFVEIIDILGGVDIEVTSAEANYMRQNGVSAKEGMNHFSGSAALAFARVRSLSGGDYARTERQRRLIQAVLNGLSDIGVTEMLTLVNKVLPYVTTDLTDAQIIEYATAGLNALAKSGEVKSTRIPQDDAHYPATIRGMSVLVPDLKMCQEDLMAFTGE